MSRSNLLTLFVMTEKGLVFVEQAVTHFKDIIAEVVIGQDAAVLNDYSDQISALCDSAGVKFRYRKDFSEITTEYAMAISWRWLINHAPEKLIVFHDSELPKYRGFAPLVNALINGESRVGVSAILGASEYDRGDIIHQTSVPIRYPITIADAIKAIGDCYLSSGLAVLQTLARGEPLLAKAQDHKQATYSLWRDDGDYKIDWSQSAKRIRRMIDAVGNPYKGALCHVDGVPARILAAEDQDDVQIENRTAGKVIFVEDGLPVVVCGTGLLKVTACVTDKERAAMLPLSKFRARFS
ncbi:methionyl-tRNA formyltransferase [Pseudomonas sp. S30_BP2TU TE3576]|uniref:methionyl-tRNA formyltransferase n=1 Tax=Pseudomonas sp. S30_BP2TU TE3576 TaxID=3349329 RepID=UPI003D25C769